MVALPLDRRLSEPGVSALMWGSASILLALTGTLPVNDKWRCSCALRTQWDSLAVRARGVRSTARFNHRLAICRSWS